MNKRMIFGIPNPFPGAFIAVEGIDGSGKSTQLRLMTHWAENWVIRNRGGIPMNPRPQVFVTQEPDPMTRFGCMIHEDLARGRDGLHHTDPASFQTWYALESKERMKRVVRRQLEFGNIVLSDRCRLSMVYGIRDSSKWEDELVTLLDMNWAIMGEDFIWPDHIRLLDVSVDEALVRMRAADKQADGHEHREKLQEVRSSYLRMDQVRACNIHVTNLRNTPEEVFSHGEILFGNILRRKYLRS